MQNADYVELYYEDKPSKPSPIYETLLRKTPVIWNDVYYFSVESILDANGENANMVFVALLLQIFYQHGIFYKMLLTSDYNIYIRGIGRCHELEKVVRMEQEKIDCHIERTRLKGEDSEPWIYHGISREEYEQYYVNHDWECSEDEDMFFTSDEDDDI